MYLMLIGVVSNTWAQAPFSEGTLIYRIDTIRRLEPQPSQYRAVQFKLYKKADLIRVETLYINKFDSTDRQRMIEIRNRKGIYLISEEKPSFPIDSLMKELSMTKDSLLKVLPWLNDFAQFTTYEEEKLNRSNAALRGMLETYTIKNVGRKSTLLSMPTEQLVITSSDKEDLIDVQVTKTITAPVGLFFDPFLKVTGTPVQFTDSRDGWLYRYTIESVGNRPLSDTLFQIDPKLRVLTNEQVLQEANDLIK